ncbi:nickel pincer cofactor biosynthesis protein LarC [Terrisporobacter mayombei]|uniref:Pyridinium-3,5-bisthiocarboxylic acid mononucleotide nickel insertion protein n=1 Tax=Terrisporobacter mayombei TaxID=1541 RepID=A0ABY9Q300_9FIRM|nr:nickel pincer cofactor biosynthesis protein LarC [Terrisporobacter mayombei]MCC3867697.1 nickel pincer cofactor biosynthesis protein LarC [Terrisporobacter mayombei]WMT81959.1 Pyridinium-3,5-bisthiocarboxylic acid mononucleotide nickel insertion protein [Terrisporobacter mayombei]
MSNKLYLECYSGISGDMTVAALLDLGASEEVLNKALESLPVDGFKTEISRVIKSGLDACDFNVILDHKHENHDHDMNYLYGEDDHSHDAHHEHHHDHDHAHNHHHHNHNHEEAHSHEHNDHHEHRGLSDVISIIEKANITSNAKQIAVNIFNILGEAEAAAHGVSIDEVHFHEVGAVDSIVDIIAVAVCLDNLEIEEVVVPVLYEGCGFIRCQHGVIPVPVPAVSKIVANNNLKLRLTNIEAELVTPTGAAIVAAIKTEDKLPGEFSIKKIGLGAGKRTYERPSILRAMLIEDESEYNDFIVKLESNIDDCSGEALGYVMERLYKAGARDVHYMPVFMKKNRPAYQLNVVCKEEDVAKLEDIIFEETTTIGIRKQKMERSILKRKIKKVQTSLGEVVVKVCHLSRGKRIYPEYESVIEMCKKHNRPYQDVYQIIVKECSDELN